VVKIEALLKDNSSTFLQYGTELGQFSAVARGLLQVKLVKPQKLGK